MLSGPNGPGASGPFGPWLGPLTPGWRLPSARPWQWERYRSPAVPLPHVIRYNGTVPTKLMGRPKYENYRAPDASRASQATGA
ncbi:hypothetical protein GCM10010251_81060 [Streptomyces aurantiogriseus]|uniref:Uncharacterized protein n=1 Tax=Streptomyces aurantiogriseus TaxID=66870 RepID=A0A918FLX0_9ACTN|nr:hypothetical protein GCM10010251_81060 [Streptomyces aurantiogriseus]